MAANNPLSELPVAEITIIQTAIDRELKKAEDKIKAWADKVKPLLSLAVRGNASQTEKALGKMVDELKSLTKASEQSAKNIEKLFTSIGNSAVAGLAGPLQKAQTMVATGVGNTYAAAVKQATAQTTKAIEEAAEKALARRSPKTLVSAFRGNTKLMTQTGTSETQLRDEEQLIKAQLARINEARINAAQGNNDQLKRIAREHNAAMLGIDQEMVKATARVRMDAAVKLPAQLATLRNVETKQRADAGRAIMDIIARKEKLLLDAIDKKFAREYAKEKNNKQRMAELERLHQAELHGIRQAAGGQTFSVKRELARVQERESGSAMGEGLNIHQFGMVQAMKQTVSQIGAQLGDMFSKFSAQLGGAIGQGVNVFSTQVSNTWHVAQTRAEAEQKGFMGTLKNFFKSPGALLAAGAAAAATAVVALGAAARDVAKEVSTATTDLMRRLDNLDAAKLHSLQNEFKTTAIIAKTSLAETTRTVGEWMKALPTATLESSLKSVQDLSKAAQAFGVDQAGLMRQVQYDINQFGGDATNLEEVNDRINRNASIMALARMEGKEFSNEQTKVLDKLNVLTGGTDQAREAFEAWIVTIGQATGDGEKTLEMIDELSEELGDSGLRGKLRDVQTSLKEQGKALIEGFDFDTGAVTDMEKFIGTLKNAEGALVTVTEGKNKFQAPFRWDQVFNPAEQAEAFSGLQILLDAGAEGYRGALDKIGNATNDAAQKLFQFNNSATGIMQEQESKINVILAGLGQSVFGVETSLGRLTNSMLDFFLPAEVAASTARDKLANISEVTQGLQPVLTSVAQEVNSLLNAGGGTLTQESLAKIEQQLPTIGTISTASATELSKVIANPADPISQDKLEKLKVALQDVKDGAEAVFNLQMLDTLKAQGNAATEELEKIATRAFDKSVELREAHRFGDFFDIDTDNLSESIQSQLSEVFSKIGDSNQQFMNKRSFFGGMDENVAGVTAQLEGVIAKYREGLAVLEQAGKHGSEGWGEIVRALREAESSLVSVNQIYNDTAAKVLDIAATQAQNNDLVLENLSYEQQRQYIMDAIAGIGTLEAGTRAQILDILTRQLDTSNALTEAEIAILNNTGICLDTNQQISAEQLAQIDAYITQQAQLGNMIGQERQLLQLTIDRVKASGGAGVTVKGKFGKEQTIFAKDTEIISGMQEQANALGKQQEIINKTVADTTAARDKLVAGNDARAKKDTERREKAHQGAVNNIVKGGGAARRKIEDDTNKKSKSAADKAAKEAEKAAEKAAKEEEARLKKIADTVGGIYDQIYSEQTNLQGTYLNDLDRGLHEEQRRYQKHLDDLKAEFGENTEVMQAAHKLHEAKVLQIQTAANKKAVDEAKAKAEKLKEEQKQAAQTLIDFQMANDKTIRDARLVGIEAEISQEQDKYTEMLRLAKKFGFDQTGIIEQQIRAIGEIYRVRIAEITKSVMLTAEGFYPVSEARRAYQALNAELKNVAGGMGSLTDQYKALQNEEKRILNVTGPAAQDRAKAATQASRDALHDVNSAIEEIRKGYAEYDLKEGNTPALLGSIQQAIKHKYKVDIELGGFLEATQVQEHAQALKQQELLQVDLDNTASQVAKKQKEIDDLNHVIANTKDKTDIKRSKGEIETASKEKAKIEADLKIKTKELEDHKKQIAIDEGRYSEASKKAAIGGTATQGSVVYEALIKDAGVDPIAQAKDKAMQIIIAQTQAMGSLQANADKADAEWKALQIRLGEVSEKMQSLEQQLPAAATVEAITGMDAFLKRMAIYIKDVDSLNDRVDKLRGKFKAIDPDTQKFIDELGEISQLNKDIKQHEDDTRFGFGLAEGVEISVKTFEDLFLFQSDLIDKQKDLVTDLAKQAEVAKLLQSFSREGNIKGNDIGNSIADAMAARMPAMAKVFAREAAEWFNKPMSPPVGEVTGTVIAETMKEKAPTIADKIAEAQQEIADRDSGKAPAKMYPAHPMTIADLPPEERIREYQKQQAKEDNKKNRNRSKDEITLAEEAEKAKASGPIKIETTKPVEVSTDKPVALEIPAGAVVPTAKDLDFGDRQNEGEAKEQAGQRPLTQEEADAAGRLHDWRMRLLQEGGEEAVNEIRNMLLTKEGVAEFKKILTELKELALPKTAQLDEEAAMVMRAALAESIRLETARVKGDITTTVRGREREISPISEYDQQREGEAKATADFNRWAEMRRQSAIAQQKALGEEIAQAVEDGDKEKVELLKADYNRQMAIVVEMNRELELERNRHAVKMGQIADLEIRSMEDRREAMADLVGNQFDAMMKPVDQEQARYEDEDIEIAKTVSSSMAKERDLRAKIETETNQSELVSLKYQLAQEEKIQEEANKNTLANEETHKQMMHKLEREAIEKLFALVMDYAAKSEEGIRRFQKGVVGIRQAEGAGGYDAQGLLEGVSNVAGGVGSIASMFGPVGQGIGTALSIFSGITSLVGRLAGGDTQLTQAEDLKLEHERINNLLNVRKQIMSDLIALGGDLFDQASEQAEEIANQMSILNAQTEFGFLAGMSPRALIDYQDDLQVQIDADARQVAQIDRNIESGGFQLWQETGMTDAEWEVEKARIQERLDSNSMLMSEIRTRVDLMTQLRQLIFQEMEQDASLRGLQVSAGGMTAFEKARQDLAMYMETMEQATNGTLFDAFGNAVELTAQEWADLRNNITGSREAMQNATRDEFKFAREEIEHKGMMAGVGVQDQIKQSLTEQLTYEEDILANLQAEGASNDKIIAQKRIIMDLQRQLNQLGKDNANNMDRQLKSLVDFRQQMLSLARQDAVVTTDEQARLAGIEAQIRARLVQLGVPQEEIDRVIQSMEIQRYHEGGWVPGKGEELALLKGGERVVSGAEVNRVGGAQNMDAFLRGRYWEKPTAGATNISTNNSQTIGDIHIQSANAEAIWNQLKPKLDKHYKDNTIQWERQRGRYNG